MLAWGSGRLASWSGLPCESWCFGAAPPTGGLGSLSAALWCGGLPSWLALVEVLASTSGPLAFPSRGGTPRILRGLRSSLVLAVVA